MLKKTHLKQSIEHKLEEIFKELKQKESAVELGLYSGSSGTVLFLYHYYTYTKKEEVFQLFQHYLTQLISNINQCHNFYFCNGLTGIAWLLNYLGNKNALSEEIKNLTTEIDDFLLANKKDTNNFDFMHGELGIVLYFILRKKLDIAKDILNNFYQARKEDKHGIYWLSDIFDEGYKPEKIINLSLAHGSASVIVILSKLIELQKVTQASDLHYSMLEKTIAFLKTRQLLGNNIYYPSQCTYDNKGEITNEYSRLSWCYGDMGIGLSLWQAGKVLEDTKLKKEAITIYQNIVSRRFPEESKIIEGGICHGTAGIAQMYNRMYYNTNLTDFREAAIYWMNQTLKMAKYQDGVAGYKAKEATGWVNSYNLIGGVSGIGLSLLAHISEEAMDWDECFLMS